MVELNPVDPVDLARELGVDITNVTVSSGAANGQAGADASAREIVDLSLYPSVTEALLKITADRSDDTYFVVAACREAGLNLPETRWVVDSRTDLRDRLAARHDDDVLTCWDRHAAATAWVGAVPAAPPAAGPAPPAPPGPGRFFGRTGLRALDLANEVMATVTCGFGYPDKRFYTYTDGVWSPGEEPIEAEIVRLLGNRYRATHTKGVTTIIKYQPGTTPIADTPLADYINVPNGMILWENGTIVAHDPDYRSTVQLPVEYVPGATCPLFEKFLAEVLPPDLLAPTPDGPGFIWELIGYCLYSGNPFHVAVLLFGKGRNGKGTLIRVIKELLGARNCSTVSLHELSENKFRAATLYGKLANLAGDLDSKWLDNTALFKKITGHDGIQGEEKYSTSFEFSPWALPFYSANKAFGSPDSSEGWAARWVVVPFPNSFLGHEDRTLDAKLSSEAELRGILARGVAALPALMARGRFAGPQSLVDARTAFMLASDAVRAWIDEYCVIDSAAWIARSSLYRRYLQDTVSDAAKALSAREFYNRIEQIGGIRATRRNNVRGFEGIGL